jgi:hypothetical protein
MAERPSYLTSTFSMVTLFLIVGFTGVCVWMKDIASLKEVVLMVLGAYIYKKSDEMRQKANGGTNGQAPPVVPAAPK